MAGIMKYCPKCRQEMTEPFYGYYPFMKEDAMCSMHDCEMDKVDISCDEYLNITSISIDIIFLESMINLKQTDPIEYQLKMSQLKANLSNTKKQENNEVKCPKCKSTSITTGARGVNLTWGFIGASKTVNRCASCGCTWKP